MLLKKPLQVIEPAQVVHPFGGVEPTHIQRQVCIFLQAALHGSADEGACLGGGNSLDRCPHRLLLGRSTHTGPPPHEVPTRLVAVLGFEVLREGVEEKLESFPHASADVEDDVILASCEVVLTSVVVLSIWLTCLQLNLSAGLVKWVAAGQRARVKETCIKETGTRTVVISSACLADEGDCSPPAPLRISPLCSARSVLPWW